MLVCSASDLKINKLTLCSKRLISPLADEEDRYKACLLFTGQSKMGEARFRNKADMIQSI